MSGIITNSMHVASRKMGLGFTVMGSCPMSA